MSKCRKVASVNGEILLRLDAECVEMEIGSSVYRCWGAQELRIGQTSRVKIAISREVLSC